MCLSQKRIKEVEKAENRPLESDKGILWWRKVICRKKHSVSESEVCKQFFPRVPLAAPQRVAVGEAAVFLPMLSLTF